MGAIGSIGFDWEPAEASDFRHTSTIHYCVAVVADGVCVRVVSATTISTTPSPQPVTIAINTITVLLLSRSRCRQKSTAVTHYHF